MRPTFDEEMMNRWTHIAVTLIAIGMLYGFVSALKNQNPFYSARGEMLVPQDQQQHAWSWSPNPLWLPSFLLCKTPANGFGITHTRSGYLFRSQADRNLYFIGSSLLGGFLGLVIAMTIQRKRRR